MSRRLPRLVAVVLVTITLGGCSYGYDVKAVAKDGGVAFTIGSSGLFGSRTPYVNYVLVDRIGKPTSPVWKLEMQEANGPEMHELRYGEVPAKMKGTLGPKPLVIGQLYRVTFLTIDGGGEDQFVISDNGEVLNVAR
jgi:hypothetical protein